MFRIKWRRLKESNELSLKTWVLHLSVKTNTFNEVVRWKRQALYVILSQKSLRPLLYNSSKVMLHGDWFIVAIWYFSLLLPVRTIQVGWVRVTSPSMSRPAIWRPWWVWPSFVLAEISWLVTVITRLIINWKRHWCRNHHQKEESKTHGLKSAMTHLRMIIFIFVLSACS